MSFSIDCLTPHPPSPSKRLIHSRRFALSERGSRLPHAPAPRGRRQPRVGKPAQGTSSRRGGVIHRSCPQACAWLWGFVGCRHSTCAQRPLSTTVPGRAPLPAVPRIGRHAPWRDIPGHRVLAENPGQSSNQSHSPSRSSRGGAPGSSRSTFLISMQLEHGHDQVHRAKVRPILSTVLHRLEADLWIT